MIYATRSGKVPVLASCFSPRKKLSSAFCCCLLRKRATWAWEVGNLWSGNLGFDYERRLSSFNEQRLTDVSFQDRDRLNRDSNSGQLEVLYQNTLNTNVGVRVKYTENDLNDDEILGVRISNDYNETEISGVFYREGSAKSSLEASLGYTTQSYDDFDERDYKGSTGRLIYHGIITGKTRVDVSVWRETSTLSDETTTYVLAKGASITPVWSVTPIINIRGNIEYQDDDFKGQNDIVTALGGQRRSDDTWRFGIGAAWTPKRYLSLSLDYRYVDRDSSVDINDYGYQQVDAKVQVQFLPGGPSRWRDQLPIWL